MRTIGTSNGSFNDVDDFPEDDLQASDDTSRWRNVSTPKRRAHSRSRNTALANGHDQDERDEVGDSEDIPTRVPRRPKSATKTRSIAPFRRVTAAVTMYGTAFMNRANQFAASQSQSQLEDTTVTASALPSSSQAGVATPSRKKNKTGLDVRVEAMARESARLANNFRKQHEVPDYQSMTVAQLRKVAETFGLKSMRKNVLVEQLTAIWHRLNSNPKPRTEPELQPVEDEQDQDRDQDSDGGMEHVVYGTFAESSFGPSQEQRYVDKDKGRADDYEPRRSSRRYDASTMFSSDLDEDGEGSGGSESDLDDESDDEEEEDEDMDLDPKNEGEGSSERTARGGFSGGGPDGDGDDDLDDLGKEDPEDREQASPTLERRLLQFLNSRPRFRKHLLMYKPLDLEVVWAECDAAGIECTRKELRQFLDRRGIICIVPADSAVGSWRKTRAKRQKRR
ncbi:hypothetical protein BG006_011246 [Podila minutissima]|uniref:Structure-specific endonuclease subunit SLX4 n=1 Tax=Podila minutissima TaxID=64525 RepID=A0A9P5SPT0_9FUNG|nr:hypothetical protein BG006_011246 [Podila minutissima]